MRKEMDRRTLLSSERGLRPKAKARFGMALCYPNTYETGMSNLGFLTIYRIGNEFPELRCERAFYTPGDMKTIETGRDIAKFDLIGISLSYEMDYQRAVSMIGSSGIPLLSEERVDKDPIVIAGGPAVTLNPLPLAPFIDVFFIGEAEESFSEFVGVLIDAGRVRKSGWRKELLERASAIEGVYVPELGNRVRRRWLSRLEGYDTCSPLVTPNSHFSDMYLVEVSRGCPRGCRFCAATYMYRPFRVRSAASIIQHVRDQDLEFGRIGLVGAAVSDHPEIERLCMEFAKSGREVGISSLRLDMVTPLLLSTLVKAGMKTATIAPEAGSERLREVIGKPMREELIIESARLCQEAGLNNIRLYFMVGLPFEEISDAHAIADLVGAISHVFRRRISVRLSPFVPKPNTPFQWEKVTPPETILKRIGSIKKGLKSRKNVEVVARDLKEVELQALFSRGGSEVGLSLRNWHLTGNWKKSLEAAGVRIQVSVYDGLPLEGPLPWDFIDMSFSKSLLEKELMKARKAALKLPSRKDPD
jgi:radical SAM superfamily enzyme YgiQ (UPF0313 family)